MNDLGSAIRLVDICDEGGGLLREADTMVVKKLPGGSRGYRWLPAKLCINRKITPNEYTICERYLALLEMASAITNRVSVGGAYSSGFGAELLTDRQIAAREDLARATSALGLKTMQAIDTITSAATLKDAARALQWEQRNTVLRVREALNRFERWLDSRGKPMSIEVLGLDGFELYE